MDETVELMLMAEQQLDCIGDTLDQQTEKFIGLQKKLGINKRILFENDSKLDRLKNALKIKKFGFLILIIMLLFLFALFAVIYFK